MTHLMAAKLQAAEAIEEKFSSEGLAALGDGGETMGMALAKSLLNQLQSEKAAFSRTIGQERLAITPAEFIEILPGISQLF